MSQQGPDIAKARQACSASKARFGIGFLMWFCIIAAVGYVLVGIIACFFAPPKPTSDKLEQLSWYATYLQGTAGIDWSAATVFALLAAFVAQKQQIHIQLEDIKEQREQFEKQLNSQREQIDEQRKQFQVQQDESRRTDCDNQFFKLIDLLNQNVINTRHKFPSSDGKAHSVEGRECFRMWDMNLMEHYEKRKREMCSQANPVSIDEKSQLGKICTEFFDSNIIDLFHYFKTVTYLMDFLASNNTITLDCGKKYIRLLVAQMSVFEMSLIFYYCLSETGDQMKQLTLKLRLFEFVGAAGLFHWEHWKIYDETFFKRFKVVAPSIPTGQHKAN